MPSKQRTDIVSEKTELLYGIHPVTEALRAARRRFFEIFIVKDRSSERLERTLALVTAAKIPVRKLSRSQLQARTNTDENQGIAARVSTYPMTGMSEILDRSCDGGNDPFILLLDSIVDPHNLGALVRTAFCAGVQGIVIPKDRSVGPVPAASKASAGALEHVYLARVVNMVNTIKELKEKGIWVAGTDPSAEKSLYACDLTGPLAIVIGGEEKGIRPLVGKHCDFLMSIPQKGALNSLNASVAGAIVLYEAFRQRFSC